MQKPIDNEIREIAVSELDRNIVVIAGAGTGKTTLLVNRMLHLLLGHKRFQKEESPVLRIAAMTFTEKAASDMKVRLMGELEKIVAVIRGNASPDERRRREEFLAHIRDTYHTTHAEIERRARKSLEDMDKALIGTIHSFAAHILRLNPIESGVTPGFTVDEGDAFEELFDKEWNTWIGEELALTAPRAHLWKDVLRRLDLAYLKDLAKRLSEFTIPLDSLSSKKSNISNTSLLIDSIFQRIMGIVPFCEKPDNKLLLQLQEISKVLDAMKKQGIGHLHTGGEYDFDKKPSEAKTGWTAEGFETAHELVKECHTLLKKLKNVDDAFITATIDIILPFATAFRQTYLSQGYVSFDGLLILTRDLLQKKEYRSVREKLKNDFRTILVDEFQDTDPVQYEIVLFLAEALGHYSTDARKVVLEQGKLFIVGDPKQSIYAFRRADIEAYEYVVKQVCGQGEPLKLQENFRSHSGIIEVVNQLFDGRIMAEQPGLQPRYIPIHANRPKRHPFQKVEIVLVSDKEGEELKADEAREAEAEWIARWITQHVNHEDIADVLAENGVRRLAYRDVALLLRAFTQVRPYVEALKRYGIPYIVEGEKYFYSTQEILDFINLLRIIENPHDLIALVGVLRSPMVGLTDREIYELKENHLLDYRKSISDEASLSPHDTEEVGNNPSESPCMKKGVENLPQDVKKIIELFYGFLKKIHTRAGIIPVSQLITEVLDSTHIAEITASAWHGEQKLANLWKLHRMASDMEQAGSISLKTFLDRIKVRIREAREEGESPLSDETLDVVKILTIHKSKGLEFPVVILGNLHGEVRSDREVLDGAVFDWSTSTTGIVVGRGDQQVRNLQSIVIEKKLNDRSWEEEKRVLYVATTRAKERLILMGSLKDDDKSYMGLIVQSLRDAAGIKLEEVLTDPGTTKEDERALPSKGKFTVGNAEIVVEHFRFDGIHRPQKALKEKTWDVDWTAFIEVWKKRDAGMSAAIRKPLFISPTTIALEEAMKEGMAVAPGQTEEILHVHLDEYEQPRSGNYSLSSPSEGRNKGEVIQPKRIQTDIEQAYPEHAALIGSICHRVLEGWDFHGSSAELQRSIESAVKWAITLERGAGESPVQFRGEDFVYQGEGLSPSCEGMTRKASHATVPFPPPLEGGDRGVVEKHHGIPFETLQNQDVEWINAEVTNILSGFIGSEAHKELQAARILGREVPILLNWDGQIMRGTVDILYKIGDRLVIADYKTDQVIITDLLARAEKYGYQKRVYVEAVKRCLKIDNPEFKLIFLRLGKAIAV
ncbi:MAG: hypothetical protein AYP45_15130 [Candidatus Brocadia carolinensis]|uniref:DNA 3'-5' helicase n=1 Tax=Candidatus Brocadia carolinensis TaxID=1004156 RepID=A0A1V4AQI7_9BACT|nr:MAG: hypothetical protein AYP45_15130 [Candidatus Brocadia caroliniensis]